ncbi:MAG: hypothetical protein HOV81_32295 [Kofleriaceae bacterium]|nr:hypothetical protein [Kofleriaceae bacterium]
MLIDRHRLGLLFALASSICFIACGDQKLGPDAGSGICSDGIDNDGDGKIDFPADFGCDSPEDQSEENGPACADHRDNDGDGKIDFPDDPGCIAPNADDESDDCPSGPNCPQCSDGKDNDANGTTDFPGDIGCESAADGVEFTDNPLACGPGLMIKTLPPGGVDTGMLMGSTSTVASPCGGGGGFPAVAYILHVPTPKVIVASTDEAGTAIDTVLDLRSVACSDAGSEIECHDDISSSNKKSKLTKSVAAGTYYLIVSGKTATDSGAYSVKVEMLQGEDSECTVDSDCGPGLVCRIPLGGTTMVCSQPQCSDGVDDDGDGEADYPTDPGCVAPDDNDESDTCNQNPPGASCPECSDGIDNNGDGTIDYLQEPNCHSAAGSSEACVQAEDVLPITQMVMMGTTVGATNDFKPTCASSSSHSAGDVVYRIDIPTQMASLKIDFANSYDAVIAFLDSTCKAPALQCTDTPETITRTNLAPGTYYVVVDGYSSATGPFTMTTTGTIPAGQSCEGPLALAGAFTCVNGFTCGGTVGSRTCVPVACADGMDNDGDGKTDYPNDPGCMTPGDMDESGDDCSPTVGPNCPACSDGMDNDLDGLTDFPADTSCPTSLGVNEQCNQSEPIIVATTGTVMGTTVGATNDFRPPAGSVGSPSHLCSTSTDSSATAPDVAVQIDVPAMDTLAMTLSPVSFDSTYVLLNSTCGGTALQCYDSPTGMNSLTNVAAGRYYVIIDGYSSASGTFTLNISGKIKNGGSCESPLAQSGALTCNTGYACSGAMGSRTCQVAQCNDGIDNDGDAKIDVAGDPGCTGINDDDETDDCGPPSGPNCPACADGVDNDADGTTDFPADVSCIHPSNNSEACTQSEQIIVATTPMTMATTAGAVNDYRPVAGQVNGHTCGIGATSTHSSPDIGIRLDLPAMQKLSLVIDNTWDSVHSLLNSTCGGSPIECYDDEDGMTNVTNLAAGTYYLIVDGWSSATASGPFTLITSGIIQPGESCESALAQSGAITCPANYTCSGTPGARRCLAQFQCSDGMDNDGDGKIDYPLEPGCTSATDNDEADDCFPVAGPNCPQCGDGIDNDMDMLIDTNDSRCTNASFFSEAFCTPERVDDILGYITMPTTAGTLAGAADNYDQSCNSNTANDVVWGLSLPVPVARLQIDTIGSMGDTILSFRDLLCSAEVECDDDDGGGLDSLIVRSNVAAGDYSIIVDSYGGNGNNNLPYSLNVRGFVAAGTACTDPLFAAGVLSCTSGTTCTAGTCQ